MGRKALLITHSGDHYTVDRVQAALVRRGSEPLRVDSDLFPRDVTIALPAEGLFGATLTHDGTRIALEDVRAVWMRRMWAAHGLAAHVDPRFAPAAARESRTLFRGMLHRLESSATVVSSFEAILAAEEKPRQLDTARAHGFDTPKTVMTNDPLVVRAFFDEHGGAVVTKLFGALSQTMDASGDFVYTRRVVRADLAHLDGLALAPQIFQEEIPKAREFRVVVVGERVFAGALAGPARPTDDVDWRRTRAGSRAWERVTLDDETVRRAVSITRGFGLAMSAIDLVERTDGRLIFLELNPAGEWGFLERDCGLPISEAIADALVHDGPSRPTIGAPT